LYNRPGGRRQAPRLKKQYRPIETAVLFGGAPLADWDDAWMVRIRSPRIMTSGWMTVLPPSMMFWVPTSVALRATLLPVSCRRDPRSVLVYFVGMGAGNLHLPSQYTLPLAVFATSC
jgi:hypothetical protein